MSSALDSWGWMSPDTLMVLILACEVGPGKSDLARWNEMRMVGHVVLNRMESPRWRATVKEVVLQPKQFSCVGDVNWIGLLKGEKGKAWAGVLETARLAWRAVRQERWEWREDPTNGATHYFSPVSMRPEWYNDEGTMPRNWPVVLVETTPLYINSYRFRFFAFPEDRSWHRVPSMARPLLPDPPPPEGREL